MQMHLNVEKHRTTSEVKQLKRIYREPSFVEASRMDHMRTTIPAEYSETIEKKQLVLIQDLL